MRSRLRIAVVSMLVLVAWSQPVALGAPVAPYIPQAATEPHTPLLHEMQFVGIATWFDAERGNQSSWYTRSGIKYYGAIGALIRSLKPHYWRTSWDVLITSRITGKSVIVHVVDECTCWGVRADPTDERLIDLSPAVWDALGVPLSRGVMPIILEVLP